MQTSRLLILFLLLLACTASACEPATVPEPPKVPAILSKSDGDNQEAEVGTTLRYPLVVIVLTADGLPVQGVEVNWRLVYTNTGALSAPASITDAKGRARVEWTLSTRIQHHVVTAWAANLPPVQFVAVPRPAPPVSFEIHGNWRTCPAGTRTPFGVGVLDRYGNRVPYIPVEFQVATGGGSVGSSFLVTNEIGWTSNVWLLGSAVGRQTLTVSSPGLTPGVVTVNATASEAGRSWC